MQNPEANSCLCKTGMQANLGMNKRPYTVLDQVHLPASVMFSSWPQHPRVSTLDTPLHKYKGKRFGRQVFEPLAFVLVQGSVHSCCRHSLQERHQVHLCAPKTSRQGRRQCFVAKRVAVPVNPCDAAGQHDRGTRHKRLTEHVI